MQEPAVLTHRKSEMVLAVHSDASYLNEEEARSRAGGHHFLLEDVPFPPNNGAIHNVAEIIKGVMSSAAEAELGAMYIMLSQTVLLCMISNDCMAPYWGPRGAYVMSYQANAILKT